MKKITVHLARPRNPLVAPMRARLGGLHRRSASALRQAGQRALRDTLRNEPHRTPDWR
jgi:hypothetical protein